MIVNIYGVPTIWIQFGQLMRFGANTIKKKKINIFELARKY